MFCNSMFGCTADGFNFALVTLFCLCLSQQSQSLGSVWFQSNWGTATFMRLTEKPSHDCEVLAGNFTAIRLRSAHRHGFVYIRLVTVGQWGVTPRLLDCCFSTLPPSANTQVRVVHFKKDFLHHLNSDQCVLLSYFQNVSKIWLVYIIWLFYFFSNSRLAPFFYLFSTKEENLGHNLLV